MTRGDFPVGGSPEAVAKWFGFASPAELEASHARYAEEMTAATIGEESATAEAWVVDPAELARVHGYPYQLAADPEPEAEL
jgi:hypothetical protein